ncbi:hypothetical protein BGZ90_007930, partial [Linnemannia elongata]
MELSLRIPSPLSTNTQNKSGLPVLRDPKYVQRGPTKANQAPISNTAVVDAVPNHQHPPLIPMLQSETPQQGVQVMHLPNKNKT